MSTEEEVRKILKMTMPELLRYILENQECLCDPYYNAFGSAIRSRALELLK